MNQFLQNSSEYIHLFPLKNIYQVWEKLRKCSSSHKLVILFVDIAAAAIVLGLRALLLLFVIFFSQKVSSSSWETLRELLQDPKTVRKTD